MPSQPPADPTPTDPTPTDPIPTDSTPADPAPTDPIPTDPTQAAPTPAAPTAAPRPRGRRKLAGIIAVAAAGALILVGGGAAAGAAISTAMVQSSFTGSTSDTTPLPTDADTSRGTGPARGNDRLGGAEQPGTSGRTPTESTSTTATPSTAAEQVGVVTILTTVGYTDSAEAAGTGMVISEDGRVLTNNHVIDGSTSIEVTVESTGETYSATVIGSDATADVAVLQLQNASGLTAVNFDTNDTTAVGDEVYSVGNAQGTGDLVTARGIVTDIDQTIAVGSESSGERTSLTGLIEVDADVVSGDSGGPLFDSEGDVIGLITAASSGSPSIVGYAIDIDAVLSVVQQIDAGDESGTVQIGETPFLGVQLSGSSTRGAVAGATIAGVIAGKPAAIIGLAAGDTITAVDSTAVASGEALSTAIAAHEVGDTVTIAWTDAAGASHTASVVLVAGPA